MKSIDKKEKRTPIYLAIIFLLFAIGISIAGVKYFKSYEKNLRTEVENQLTAIADLKVGEIVQWGKERLGDAAMFYRNRDFTGHVKRYLEKPNALNAKDEILSWMKKIKESYGYDRLCFHDLKGVERLSYPTEIDHIDTIFTRKSNEVLRTKQVAFQDFYRDAFDGRVYLHILIPIISNDKDSNILGILAMRIDPETYLYPLINSWPTPSKTSETLIARREGDNAVYLNELKFEKNTALNLHIALNRKDILVVKAVLGEKGVIEGMDYKGDEVIGYACPVPNSPWFMVARMDMAEVFAPLKELQWMIITLVIVLIFGSGAGVGLIWRHQRAKYYRDKSDAALALLASEIRYRRLFESAKDGILILDADTGMIVDVNPFLVEMLGYSYELFLGKAIWDIGFFKDIVANEAHFLELRQKEYIRYEDLPLETSDGKKVYVEFVSNVYLVNDKKVIQCNIRDITERKRTEHALRDSEERFNLAMKASNDGLFDWNLETNEIYYAPAWKKMLGYEDSELPNDFSVWETTTDKEDVKKSWELQQKLISKQIDRFVLEFKMKHKKGHWVDILSRAEAIFNTDGKAIRIVGTHTDITERKLAEEVLILQKRIADIFLSIPDEEMFNEVLKVILEVMESPFGVFGYIDENGALVVPTMTRQIWDKCDVPEKSIVFPRDTWGDSSWPTAVREKKPNYSNKISNKTPEGHVTLTRHISLPILFKEEVIGLFQVANKETDYTEEDIHMLESIAGYVSPVLKARLLKQLSEEEIIKLNAELEQKVIERTQELGDKNAELIRMNKLFVGRELRMKELKEKIKELENLKFKT